MQKNQIDQDHYVVEKIIGKKIVKDKLFYKVKWQGYSENQCTWEKKSHLRYVTSLIEEFQKQETAFTNTMKSPLRSYDQCSSSDSPANVLKTSSDTQNECNIAKLSKSNRKNTKQSQSNGEKADSEKTGDKESNQSNEKETIQISQERKDNTSNQGSSQSLNAKKSKKKLLKLSKQSKKAQKSKKLLRKNLQDRNKATISQADRVFSSVMKPLQFGERKTKAEESNEKQEKKGQVVIKLIEADNQSSDIREYVVIYRNGESKVYNTWQLFYAHPVEFVGYLEKKAKKR